MPSGPRLNSVPSASRSALYFANCGAARAAGKAPLFRGSPGYRAALDRDGDGRACE
nr:excalibur calcium-binding domain-containing protein [Deinococcus arcticus]